MPTIPEFRTLLATANAVLLSQLPPAVAYRPFTPTLADVGRIAVLQADYCASLSPCDWASVTPTQLEALINGQVAQGAELAALPNTLAVFGTGRPLTPLLDRPQTWELVAPLVDPALTQPEWLQAAAVASVPWLRMLKAEGYTEVLASGPNLPATTITRTELTIAVTTPLAATPVATTPVASALAYYENALGVPVTP